YLLEAADDRKVRDRVRQRDAPAHGHAGGEAGHVLLGDAGVDELFGKLFGEFDDDAESEVADDEGDALILARELGQLADERAPHSSSPNSSIAFLNSSPCGVR